MYSRPYQSALIVSYIEAIKKALKRLGVNSSGVRYGNTPYYFHDLILRIPETKPRRVLLSDVIRNDSQKLQAVDFIKRKAERGESIWPHLSRGWGRLKNLDKLYNNWEVYHLHLGEAIEKDGYVSRTQDVLLLRISTDAMHFIDVRGHGEEFPNLWYDVGIMNIVLKNWPDQLAKYKSLMTGHNVPESSADLIKQYRDGNFNTPLILSDGCAYVSPGMVSLEGLGSLSGLHYNYLIRTFGVVEQVWIEAPYELINFYFPWRVPPASLDLYVDPDWPICIKAKDSNRSLSITDVWRLANSVVDLRYKAHQYR